MPHMTYITYVCMCPRAGSDVFTFRRANELLERLLSAHSLALHTALSEPQKFLSGLEEG